MYVSLKRIQIVVLEPQLVNAELHQEPVFKKLILAILVSMIGQKMILVIMIIIVAQDIFVQALVQIFAVGPVTTASQTVKYLY